MKAIEELNQIIATESLEDREIAFSTWLRRNTTGFGVSMTLVEGRGKEVDAKLSQMKDAVKKLAENVLEEGVTTTVEGGRLTVDLLLIRDGNELRNP